MTDSILVVGGGVAGLHAAMLCAERGARAIVVERGPVVGGRLAATMIAAGAIGDRAEGAAPPLIESLAANESVEIITLAELESLEGRPGNFRATVRERARFVTDACTRCALCRAVCPVVLGNEYDAGLTFRKAIYTPMTETLPQAWVIDDTNCLNTPPNYLPCNRCVEVCEDDAIHFDMVLDTLHERHVGAVVLAPGFRTVDSRRYADLGYGSHPDIVTSAELQRLLESPGPTGGYASKPSDEEYPDSVLLVLDNPSRFALYIVASQARQLLAQDIASVSVLVLSPMAAGSEYADIEKLAGETGVRVRWGTGFRAEPESDDALGVSFEDFAEKRFVKERHDMVVLCSDVEPPEGLPELAGTLGVELSEEGYLANTGTNGAGVSTSKPGIFVAGCAGGPKNVRDSIATAEEAARSALALLDPRLLEGEAAPLPEPEPAAAAPDAVPDDMRLRLEKLLYALLDRADG